MAVTPKLTTQQKQQINLIIKRLRAHEWQARYETLIHHAERVKGGQPPKARLLYYYLQIGKMHFKGNLFEYIMLELKREYLVCSRCVEVYKPALVMQADFMVPFNCSTRGRCAFREIMEDDRALYRQHRDDYIAYRHWQQQHLEIGTRLLDALI